MSPPPADLLTALQGLVTQWKKEDGELATFNLTDCGEASLQAYTRRRCELEAILAGVPEPPPCDCAASRVLHERTCRSVKGVPEPPTKEKGFTLRLNALGRAAEYYAREDR